MSHMLAHANVLRTAVFWIFLLYVFTTFFEHVYYQKISLYNFTLSVLHTIATFMRTNRLHQSNKLHTSNRSNHNIKLH